MFKPMIYYQSRCRVSAGDKEWFDFQTDKLRSGPFMSKCETKEVDDSDSMPIERNQEHKG